MMKRFLLMYILCLQVAFSVAAQQSAGNAAVDSTLLYENQMLGKLLEFQGNLSDFMFRETTVFDREPMFKLLPSIKRTPGYGFSLGLGGAVSFYTDKTRLQLSRSEVPLYFSVAFTKPFSYSIGSSPQFYFSSNALRLRAEISYRNWLEYYFGVGYSLNHSQAYGKDHYTYESRMLMFKPNVQFRLGNRPLYGGVVADVWHESVKNPETFVAADRHFVELAGGGTSFSMTGTGIGVNLSYDSRDVPDDAYCGVYFEAEAMFYNSALGGDAKYGTITADYRQYVQLGGRKQVLAWNVTSNNVFGNHVPFMRYATVGGVNIFRGYYNYQYRDKSMLTAQVEYRYWLQVNGDWGVLLNRFGFAAWVGTGVIGRNIVRYDHLLPQAGLGVRFALRDRLNFRFDVAHNPIDNDTLWYIGFSESF